MKAFLSIIYIETNSLSTEKISCGLLGVSPDHIYFKISESKVEIASEISNSGLKNIVKSSLAQIKNKVEQINKQLGQQTNHLFEVENIFNHEYIKYLSNYSGVLQFNEPKPFNGTLTHDSFDVIFDKFFPKNSKKENHPNDFALQVNKILAKPSLKEKADINLKFKPEQFFGLLKTATVTLATANGQVNLFQLVDFENTESSVASKLYEFDAVTKVISDYVQKKLSLKTKASIITNEPSETGHKKFFETVYKVEKGKGVEFLDPAKLEEATKKIISEPNSKFSERISSVKS